MASDRDAEGVEGLDRRSVLRNALVGTSFGAAAVFAEAVPAEAKAGGKGRGRRRGKTVEFDVACRGSTFRVIFPPDANPAGGDLYGGVIMVEGYMYPAGSLPSGASTFDPENDAAHAHVGHWFCASTFILGPRRDVPHLMGHQQYVFGRMDAGDNAFQANQMASLGFEGANAAPRTFNRALSGGTGKYSGARGEAFQTLIGTNASLLAQLGGSNAPNFKFKISLK